MALYIIQLSTKTDSPIDEITTKFTHFVKDLSLKAKRFYTSNLAL